MEKRRRSLVWEEIARLGGCYECGKAAGKANSKLQGSGYGIAHSAPHFKEMSHCLDLSLSLHVRRPGNVKFFIFRSCLREGINRNLPNITSSSCTGRIQLHHRRDQSHIYHAYEKLNIIGKIVHQSIISEFEHFHIAS
jgi:hypothetical protein